MCYGPTLDDHGRMLVTAQRVHSLRIECNGPLLQGHPCRCHSKGFLPGIRVLDHRKHVRIQTFAEET